MTAQHTKFGEETMAFKDGVILGPVSLNATGSANTNIGGTTNTGTITIGNATSGAITITGGPASVAVTTNGAGDITLNSSDTVLIDSVGILELNSSAGVIGIGNDAVAQNINIGTGAAARVITIGNVTGVTAVAINSGTSGVTISSTGAGDILATSGDAVIIDGAGVIEINSSAAAIAIGNDAVAQPINIGTGTAARTITIGNQTGATAVNTNIGTGDFTLTSATGNIINARDTGEISYPLQPAFLAYLGTTDANVTGNGTTFTLGSVTALTEVFDQNGDFNTNGTFTAPVTGRYQFNWQAEGTGATVATTMTSNLNTSNRNYLFEIYRAASNLPIARSGSVLAEMDSGDTATVGITVFGEAGNTVDIIGDATNPYNAFSGYLAA